MLRVKKRNHRAGPALRPAPAAAAIMVRAALSAVAGLAVTAAVAAVPALAAQHLPGPAASHSGPPATRQGALTARVAHGPHWAHLAAGFDFSCGIRTDGTLWCWGRGDISEDLQAGHYPGARRLGQHHRRPRPRLRNPRRRYPVVLGG